MILKDTIGKNQLAIVTLILSLVAAGSTKIFEKLMGNIGTHPVMLIGSLSFVAEAMLYLFTSIAWQGWWIATFWVLIGIQFGAYDSVCRAISIDHFPGEQSAYAMASLTQWQFLAGMISFLMNLFGMDNGLNNRVHLICVVVFAGAIMPALCVADRLRARERKNDLTENAEDSRA